MFFIICSLIGNGPNTFLFLQGQTVKAGTKTILHDITQKNMVNAMAYTLFGRSQRLEDIHICGAFEKEGIKYDEDALLETKRLEKVFDDNEEVKKLKRANHWKISYLNVSSLNAHWEDVSIDNEINDSDVIGLGETWLEENKTVDLLNFAGYFANFGRGKGQAAFSKMQLSCQPEIVASSQFSAILLKTSKSFQHNISLSQPKL